MQTPPHQNVPAPITVLLGATLQLYLRTFKPLFATAAVIAVVLSIVGSRVLPEPDIDRPESVLPALLASIVFQSLSIGVFSVVLWRAALLRRGESSSLSGTIRAALTFGPRCFAGAFLLGLLFLFALASIPLLLPVIVYVWVRASLYMPAVVLENRSIVGGFVRSWHLVSNRWFRTLLLEAIVTVPFFTVTAALTIPLAGPDSSSLALIVIDVLSNGVFVPFLSVFGLLLFEDYRGGSDGGDSPLQVVGRPPPDDPR